MRCGHKKRRQDINRAFAWGAIWQIARHMADCFSPSTVAFVCSGPMSIKALSKIFVVVAFVIIFGWGWGWRVVGHPAYLDLYANDPRSKPELRHKCAICHEPTARAKDSKFLTEFGSAVQTNRLRITSEIRQRLKAVFVSAD